MTNITAKLKGLFSEALETLLETTEIDQHSGYDKHSVPGSNSGNSWNGFVKETIKIESLAAVMTLPDYNTSKIIYGGASCI